MKFSRLEYWSGYSLLQGIFPTRGLNPGLPHCRWTLPEEGNKECKRTKYVREYDRELETGEPGP